MDAEMFAYWSRLVDYHERQAEMWLSFAEQRRSALIRCRAVSTILRKSWPSLMNEQFERSMESRVEQCRRMAADHRRMACHYRASLETPWPTVAHLGRVVPAIRGEVEITPDYARFSPPPAIGGLGPFEEQVGHGDHGSFSVEALGRDHER
jgi:hypothetical protein